MNLKKLASDAIAVQDACNLSGVVHGFSRAIKALREALTEAKLPTDTDAINQHPICKLWASKIHDLTRMGFSDQDAYSEAYHACQQLANE